MTGDDVWREGMNDDLFIESKKQAVYEDQHSRQQYIQEKMEEDRQHARAKFDSDQYQAWVTKGDQLSSPQTVVQPFVVAAAAPELVAAAYFGAQTGEMVGNTVNACKDGSPADCAAATAQMVAALALQRALKAKSGETPKPPPPENPDLTFPRGTDVTNRSAFPPPETVTDPEAVATNAKNPAQPDPDSTAIPEPITGEPVTQKIPAGEPPPGEVVGDYRLQGEKIPGKTFVRRILGITRIKPVPSPPSPEPLFQAPFESFIQEARASGAERLRVTIETIRVPTVIKRVDEIRGWIQSLGGQVNRLDAMTVEVIVPLRTR